MNEADTRAELIDPALKEAGWGVVAGSRVRREVITLGRLQGAGQRTRGDIADYVLFYKGQKLAVIEAKMRDLPITEGLAQAKRYAERLQARFAYATNGVGLYRVDMHTGKEGPVDGYPSPQALWAETFPEPNAWRERFLRRFQDNEKTIPTILATSQKLSTGVDARNIRNIVLMRPVNSMIEFKQIIGRGTRLFEGKDHFTILDFVRAYEHFNDPEWDGEPMAPEPCGRCGETPCVCAVTPPAPCEAYDHRPCTCEKAPPEPCPVCGEAPCQCGGEGEGRSVVEIELSLGKYRQLQHMSATSFWSPDGTPISAADFIRRLYGDLPALFQDEETLRELWSRPDTRQGLLDRLAEKGYGSEQLRDIARLVDAENSDLFDVLAYIAFALPPISREERVATHRSQLFAEYDYRQREFLSFILDHYVESGVDVLAQERLPNLIQLKYQTPTDAIAELGSVENIRDVFIGFQARLYESA